MLPAMCMIPPCRNMLVKIVAQNGSRTTSAGRVLLPKKSAGTNPSV
jgi:hypothetical protein